jgi:TPR repeat protein
MNRSPGSWQKARLEEDPEEAKRYYGKACLLKDPRGCRLVQEMTADARSAKGHGER